jgi:hypothetical protein
MKTQKFIRSTIGIALLTGSLLGLSNTASAATIVIGSPQPAYPISFQGIHPTFREGNFVSTNDEQICYDLAAAGLIGQVTGELRGFKVDPPIDTVNGPVTIDISADGKYLAFALDPGASMQGIVVKGGPNYHVYNYVGTSFKTDSWLASPLNKAGKIPQISHYNVCYRIDPPSDFNGCTPGYWRNHADRWVGVSPADDFDATFGVEYFDPNISLGTAISNPQTYGTFAFHAVAALLNSYGGVPNADGTTVAYPYSTATVIAMVQNAVASGTTETTKNLFAQANELGCPLSGTRANPV